MRLSLIFAASLTVALRHVLATPGGSPLRPRGLDSLNNEQPNPGAPVRPRRVTSILNNPVAQPDLPSLDEASQAAAASSLNLHDIQGDILIGMKKKMEWFVFFAISDAGDFKEGLRRISDRITSTAQLLDVSEQPDVLVNIAFSQAGLNTLGHNDSLGDAIFSAGQFADAANLGDPGTTNWVPAFAGTKIHGVVLLASDSFGDLGFALGLLDLNFGFSWRQLHILQGQARPGDQEGHEHFGYMDGISQPAITGFNAKPLPGQAIIDPGRILLGESGDNTTRPAWTKGGSFLAFRQLQQLVPEFDKFLLDNPVIKPGLNPEQGSALMGARMIGRWKSGAPIDLTPFHDDPELARDPQRNNNFTFVHPGENNKSNQTRCPFSAHVRKVAPRGDFSAPEVKHHIMRSGIPYGPEVFDKERQAHTTHVERGLAFVAYQSDLSVGFHFMQHSWANNPGFFFDKVDPTPGFDPIIGANAGQPRFVDGLDPTNSTRRITLVTDFVVSRGGEYFFSPPLSAITGVLAH